MPVNPALGVDDQAEFKKWAPKDIWIRHHLNIETINLFHIEKVTLIFVYARGKPQDLSGVKNVGELWCRESTNLNRENKVAKIKLLKPLNTKGRLCLEKAGLLAFAHRQYFALGRVIGRFGFSVKKRKRKIRR